MTLLSKGILSNHHMIEKAKMLERNRYSEKE